MKNREAQALFKESELLYRERRYEEALEALKRLDARYPDTRNILYPIAKCFRRLGRFEEAAAVCDRLVIEFDDQRAKHMRHSVQQSIDRAAAQTIQVPASAQANFDDDLDAGFDALDLGDLPPLDEEAETLHIPGGYGAKPAARTQESNVPWLYIGISAVVAVVVLFGVIGAMSGGGSSSGTDTAPPAEEFNLTQFYINLAAFWMISSMISYSGSLYLTLMISDKLPYGTFSDDAISVVGFSLLCLLLGTFVPCIGLIACIIILRKRFDMGFIEFLMLVGINIGISIPFAILYFILFAGQIEELAATIETQSY